MQEQKLGQTESELAREPELTASEARLPTFLPGGLVRKGPDAYVDGQGAGLVC